MEYERLRPPLRGEPVSLLKRKVKKRKMSETNFGSMARVSPFWPSPRPFGDDRTAGVEVPHAAEQRPAMS